jgi:putative membrane protein
VKAVHVIAVIAWMAGLFYLPRLFVYHAEAGSDAEISATFKVMERRLLKAIMTPAMVASWVFGLSLVAINGVGVMMEQGWFHAKLALVVGLTIYHFWLAGFVRAFARDENRHDAKFYRVINEIPTLIMIAVVVLVVIRPF